jgi:nitrile hydratase accessory protein
MSAEKSQRTFEALAAEAGLEPVFSAPWEARAFAMALGLSEAGLFTWDEFRERLIAEVGNADRVREHDGSANPGEYYEHFLRALERLLREKGIASEAELALKLREIESATTA